MSYVHEPIVIREQFRFKLSFSGEVARKLFCYIIVDRDFRLQILVSLIYLKGKTLCSLRLRDHLRLWLQKLYKVSVTEPVGHHAQNGRTSDIFRPNGKLSDILPYKK